ncbi:MAG: DNA-directed RNA polymerase II complex subunit Rpb11 [Piptocephalis tieghemiana]|nr:MAG: DNA-directed RNA polymerase II complex subunit Rpb11 [Piptocephalis tieghemiana]
MNAPSKLDLYDDETMPKVRVELDQKIPNAATFSFLKEDHTLGNLVRSRLLKDSAVLFAGYRVPHPLNPIVEIKVQTTDVKSPVDAVKESLSALHREFDMMRQLFADQLSKARLDVARSGLDRREGGTDQVEMDF